ncbi:MAG: hypothetical protein WDZ59_11850 [Pirellulales bacterium]
MKNQHAHKALLDYFREHFVPDRLSDDPRERRRFELAMIRFGWLFGTVALGKVTPELVADFQRKIREAGFNARTARNHAGCIRAVVHHGMMHRFNRRRRLRGECRGELRLFFDEIYRPNMMPEAADETARKYVLTIRKLQSLLKRPPKLADLNVVGYAAIERATKGMNDKTHKCYCRCFRRLWEHAIDLGLLWGDSFTVAKGGAV